MSINVKKNGELTKIAGLYQTTAPIGMADIYSTEEKEVGLWIDNKPLYQKTFLITPTSASFTVDVSSLNIEKLIDRQATLSRAVSNPSSTQQKDVQYRTETSGYNGYGVVCELINDTIQVGIEGYIVSEITEIRVTLKYTKTTDTPGSGQWTPSGAPAVHYSSQEHIIGTYEGETLYERTITHEGQLSSGFNSFLTVNDIKAMIGCELSVRNSSNNSWHNCSSSSSSSSMEVQIQIDANNVGSFGVITSTTWNNPVVIATYRYTKTTD